MHHNTSTLTFFFLSSMYIIRGQILWNYIIMLQQSRLRVSTPIALGLLIISKNKQIATNAYKPLPLILDNVTHYYYCYYTSSHLINHDNLLTRPFLVINCFHPVRCCVTNEKNLNNKKKKQNIWHIQFNYVPFVSYL